MGKVVVAGGHLTDAPSRAVPRFAEADVQRVSEAIERILADWAIGPTDVVICGGGRGADLLVAEAALRRCAAVRLRLALPVDKFITRSVEMPGTNWRDRFARVAEVSDVQILAPPADGVSEFEAVNDWIIAEAMAASSATGRSAALALVVWDGHPGDGRGGTSHLVERAAAAGLQIAAIDPTPT